LQKASLDFLSGIGANIGGGSRRMPELAGITLEVTATNPTRGFRIFENEGVLVGDYRKQEGTLFDPTEDLTLWVLPLPIARLLCRIVVFGKPIEVRLAQQLLSEDAAVVHRTLLGARDGKPLRSTHLGNCTNAALAAQGCPGVHDMRHVREHFSTELMLQDEDVAIQEEKRMHAVHAHGIAAIASNHCARTARQVYAGVLEKKRCYVIVCYVIAFLLH